MLSITFVYCNAKCHYDDCLHKECHGAVEYKQAWLDYKKDFFIFKTM